MTHLNGTNGKIINISIGIVLDELLNQPDVPINNVIKKYFNPKYRQRTNGIWDNIDAFTQHAEKLREIVASAKIKILDELRSDNQYADRHLVTVNKRNGSQVIQEVYLFAQLDEFGRFKSIEETTLMLAGDEADRDIGSTK